MENEKTLHPLTEYRAAEKMTVEAFATRVGASKGMVSKWENGTIPRREQMQRIIEATGGKVDANAWYVATNLINANEGKVRG